MMTKPLVHDPMGRELGASAHPERTFIFTEVIRPRIEGSMRNK